MATKQPGRPVHVGTLILIVIAMAWTYWPTFAEMARRWTVEPTYSHGYLVPAFVALILWYRRDQIHLDQFTPNWWGLAIVLGGTAIRVAASYFSIHSPDRFSLLPTLVGLCVGLGGWAAFRWAWPGIVFSVFMIPLPAGFDGILAHPLQRLATLASAHVLQTLGFVAETEGNVILLRSGELGIVDACSGLRMFMTFCALSTAVAIVVQRSWLQKILIAVSAFPLAMVCNLARITVTGIAYETLGSVAAQFLFHDVAGLMMILMAVGLLLLELKLLSLLFVNARDEAEAGPLNIIRTRARAHTSNPEPVPVTR
jgi:exosortase